MKEYYVDIDLTNELEEWILQQGAIVTPRDIGATYDRKTGTFVNKEVDVLFNHRKIHFYANSTQVRLFFNEENVSTALILFVKFNKLILKHTIPNELRYLSV